MHIPDDPRYYEKFYFTPGDLGLQDVPDRVGAGRRVGLLGPVVSGGRAPHRDAGRGDPVLSDRNRLASGREGHVRRAPARRLGDDAAQPCDRKRLFRRGGQSHGLRARPVLERRAAGRHRVLGPELHRGAGRPRRRARARGARGGDRGRDRPRRDRREPRSAGRSSATVESTRTPRSRSASATSPEALAAPPSRCRLGGTPQIAPSPGPKSDGRP